MSKRSSVLSEEIARLREGIREVALLAESCLLESQAENSANAAIEVSSAVRHYLDGHGESEISACAECQTERNRSEQNYANSST